MRQPFPTGGIKWGGLGMSVISMDTSIRVEPSTRDDLAEYRDERGYPNYNEALSSLLQEVTAEA